MIINSDFLLPHLQKKVRHAGRDKGRHILCPRCSARTKLYVLEDGRRKCGVCGTKFSVRRRRDERLLQQYADVLLCFCMDFTATRAADITKYRYRLTFDMYTHFREFLAAQTLGEGDLRGMKNTVLYGLTVRQGRILIEPLRAGKGHRVGSFPALLSRGKLERASLKNDRTIGKLERFWSWTQERLRLYHRISDEKMGLYLKEREWKYNYRFLTPESQALLIASLLPEDFPRLWSVS